MVKIFSITFCLFFSTSSFSQFAFKDDSTDTRIQVSVSNELDKKFKLNKDNDFELRLWIFPPSSNASLFILENKEQKWSARIFKDVNFRSDSKEIKINNQNLDSLWKQLNYLDVLTIPNSWKLLDKNGDFILQRNDCILYSFELLSKNSTRHYSYYCPEEYVLKYDYIGEFRKVIAIVKLITGLEKL